MKNPDLSITIPTYNRAPYLQYLLGSLARQIGDLTHSYEIVISDNGSTDDTETVVKSFGDRLNIVYVKRDKNYGIADNRQELIKHARGTMQLNMGDDDDLILSEVDKIIAQMLADPAINVVFAPWKIYNRAADKINSHAFYPQDKDFVLERDDYESLLDLVLKNQIFPEIYIIRTDLLQAVSMVANPLAYWAFVHTAEFLTHGKVAFNKTPYYITITKHFEGDNRQQLGHVELLTAWDRYRGGLEYILSRIPQEKLTVGKFQQHLILIQKFIAMRLHVCLRLRIASKHDAMDTYYIACRLRAMGYPDLIPVDFHEIRTHAAVHYFLKSPTASDVLDKLVCVDGIPEIFMNILRTRSNKPPTIVNTFSPEAYPQALTLIPGSVRDLKVNPAILAEYKIRLMGVADLMKKFA
jgi:glycosyltransferase involved in cell wall biosynthesis